ncbi:MAG TPA: FkbM family methyltransferase [Xenococcaceae cyanobacterium]|jgi:FkbM family methyltransferase
MFISYAQNFEDIMLNRLFPDQYSGFYLDVGAHHPVIDSVTKSFYDQGWHGINIEPVKEYFELLQQTRTRDINLNIAVGETASELEFFELESTGLSTFDRETAYRLAEAENHQVISYKVPLRKLGDICREQVKCQIDFMKIDVEGWEEQVILGHDWENFRPTVVILEATIPNSPVRTETNIKTILEQHNYTRVYFDGLNDYYLAQEKESLTHCFTTPPNVFDKFIKHSVIDLRHHADNLQQVIQQRDIEVSNLQKQIQESDRQNLIFYNRLKDKEFEIQRLTQTVIQQQQNKQELRDRTATKINQYQQQIANLQAQLSQANQTISGMESSKFWKMRQAWFRLKKITPKE